MQLRPDSPKLETTRTSSKTLNPPIQQPDPPSTTPSKTLEEKKTHCESQLKTKPSPHPLQQESEQLKNEISETPILTDHTS